MFKNEINNMQLESVSKYKKERFSQINKSLRKSYKVSVTQKGLDLQSFRTNPPNHRVPYPQRQFEDSHLTQFLHEQLLNIKLHLNLAGMASILLSITRSIIPYPPTALTISLVLQSILTLWMTILVILKHYKNQELQLKQLLKVKDSLSFLYCLK